MAQLLHLVTACLLWISTKGFDINTAVRGVHYSSAAYCSPSSIKSWSCGPCRKIDNLQFKKALYAESSDTRGYIAVNTAHQEIVVAFEGTSDVTQWMDDLEFDKIPLPYPGAPSGAQVHQGFFDAYQNVKATVDSEVKALMQQHPGYGIFVAGHSLGAAISTLCALDLSLQHPGYVQSYVVGLPRVGNKDFANFFNSHLKNAWHITHHKDIVPHVPLESLGFYHVSNEVYQDEDYNGMSSLRMCNGGEDDRCAAQFGYLWDWTVSDHHVYLGIPLTGHC